MFYKETRVAISCNKVKQIIYRNRVFLLKLKNIKEQRRKILKLQDITILRLRTLIDKKEIFDVKKLYINRNTTND